MTTLLFLVEIYFGPYQSFSIDNKEFVLKGQQKKRQHFIINIITFSIALYFVSLPQLN